MHIGGVAGAPFVYERRHPEGTTLYAVVRDNVETLYAAVAESGLTLPAFVRQPGPSFQ